MAAQSGELVHVLESVTGQPGQPAQPAPGQVRRSGVGDTMTGWWFQNTNTSSNHNHNHKQLDIRSQIGYCN